MKTTGPSLSKFCLFANIKLFDIRTSCFAPIGGFSGISTFLYISGEHYTPFREEGHSPKICGSAFLSIVLSSKSSCLFYETALDSVCICFLLSSYNLTPEVWMHLSWKPKRQFFGGTYCWRADKLHSM